MTPLQLDGGAPDAEIPTIVDTDYPVPSDAIFVSLTGSDANKGTEAAPVRTVGRAIQIAPPGSTIVMRAGTYRGPGPTFSKKVTIQPYPHEQVWMKGSLEVTNWVPDGATWRLDGWTHEFCQTCLPAAAVARAFPLAASPDAVFFDGRPLKQVASLAEVIGNAFYVDYAADTIHIGVDPTDHLVEAAAFPMAFSAYTTAEGSTIRGLGIAQFAPNASSNQNGMIRVNTPGVTIENNTLAYSSHNGISLYDARDTVIRGNTFLYNGGSGIGGYRAHRLVVDRNRIAYSNQERLFVSWAVAGIKIAGVRTGTITNNSFEGNRAKAFWCDVSCHDFTIVRNLIRGNEHHGVKWELSSKAIIAGNVIVDHPTYGMSLDAVSDTKVYNNTLVRNWTAIQVNDNPWNNPSGAEIALGITWMTYHVEMYNNIFSETTGAGNSHVIARDRSDNPFKPPSTMISGLDFNAYHRSVPTYPATVADFQLTYSTNGNEVPSVKWPDLAAFTAQTGFEGNGMGIDGPDPFFVDLAAGDFQLRPDSPAVKAGMPLPYDVAAALGLPACQPVDLGAVFPSSAPQGPLGSLSVSDVTAVEGASGASKLTFFVSLSAALPAPASVKVATTATGTATAGADYEALPPTTVTWNPGDPLTKAVDVTVNGDLLRENTEIVVVSLSSPTNATIADASAVGTILNDDKGFSVYVGDANTVEGNEGAGGSAQFPVSLSHPPQPGEVVTADVGTASSSATAASDYEAPPSSVLTWNAGDPLVKTVPVAVIGDATTEPNETFFLKILATSSNATIGDVQGMGTIVNDDGTASPAPKPSISVSDATFLEKDGATYPVTFDVSLSAAPTSPVSVNLATADNTATAGSDYGARTTTLTWQPGDPLVKTVDIGIRGEFVKESVERFVVQLSAPQNAVLADPTGYGTILDNDPGFSLSVADVRMAEGSGGPSTMQFSVCLSHAPRKGETVTVKVATANGTAIAGTDYTAFPETTLSWQHGDTLAKTVDVSIEGDTTVEPNETFFLRLSAASTNTLIADNQATGTIVRDD